MAAVFTFLGLALCGYLAGMAGSLLGALRDISNVPSRDGAKVFIFILLYQVATYAPVQIVKVLIACTLAYALSGLGFCYAALISSAVCAVCGFAFMRLLPRKR
jgi:hypothetical protein